MVASDASGWQRRLGGTGLHVSAVCLGGGPLGSMPENFGYDVPVQDAVDLVTDVLASPITVIDTANGYSGGESERRIGLGIAAAGGLPPGFLVATKVDADEADYSGDRVRASVEESRTRLGLDDLPLVHLHDPEFHDFAAMTKPGGAVDALVRLRESGQVGSLGLAGGDVRVMARYLDLGVFDVLLVHNRWTLVDRSAGEIVATAHERGLGVVNAAVYGGGILARQEERPGDTYGYRPAPPETLRAVRAMRELTNRHGTDLATAALQFSLRDTRVASTIVGISKRSRIPAVLDSAASELPPDFWDELETLVPPSDTWLDA
ncbi:D-threo-aldose 1-dehydrogenase [Motilibacter peucedani]|uniref:D-threo-aldose 1-dehydrogenase n=1 Tax=Motilibacter peucedani TaxID=598650 RepID=A0A420XLF4_9ACTN|nr:aldo/keto reductase [Motilibacter peucedani]RKS69187.1 D-threo-aldose 1-dehydrogenase [Motilibacter peucedani]